ncbi:hypothetical protein [Candidatus Methylomirabilis sp.]|uniref:hypothetical protein n=1 Tax=Candidatus Methylomirabilis sp. TaxID=2032687 RepID=UPI003C789F3D
MHFSDHEYVHGVIARERSDRSNLTVVDYVVAGYNGESAALPVVARNDAGVAHEAVKGWRDKRGSDFAPKLTDQIY